MIEQIKKDFGTLLETDPDMAVSASVYQCLYEWIYPVLEHVYRNDRQRFTSLIYTIDAAFIKDKFGQRKEKELEQWVHAVLLRECLKVFMRNNYKM
ncbi:MAG TPA: hypothetical protein VD905_13425 [Flavobacteriales bacterium]|nr:hypothetical protein [Flavobacteriales bacterium]